MVQVENIERKRAISTMKFTSMSPMTTSGDKKFYATKRAANHDLQKIKGIVLFELQGHNVLTMTHLG